MESFVLGGERERSVAMVWHRSRNRRTRRGGGAGLGFGGGARAAVNERLVDVGGEESWVGVPVHQRVDL